MLFVLTAVTGEFTVFHAQAVSGRAWFALVYLIIAGSIIGFTAYVWLLHYESPTKVGTYAYVNPVVAVLLGWALGGERPTPRMGLAAAVIVLAVVVITTGRARVPARVPAGKPS